MIYLLVYGIMASCFIPFKLEKSNLYLDKESTDWIRGLAILIIMIHHAVQQNSNYQFLYPFLVLGYGGVAIFLLLSGYGIGVQYKKRSDYLNGFLKNKILRLYITFCVAYAVMYIGAWVNGSYINQRMLWHNLLTMSVADSATWYIKVQALLYVVFYIIFKNKKINDAKKLKILFGTSLIYIFICLIFDVQKYWYFTVLWFPVGMFLAWNKESIINNIKNKGNFILLCLSGILGGIVLLRFFKGNMGYPTIMDAIITITFVGLILVLVLKFRFLSKVTKWLGSLSLELYLAHGLLLTGYLGRWKFNTVVGYVGYLIMSLVIAVFVKKISEYLIGLTNRR